MWRTTGDSKYREWGWQIFKALVRYARVSDEGNSGLRSVANDRMPEASGVGDDGKSPSKWDNWNDHMESFFLSETMKYLYLLFADSSVLPLDDYVFNTEAHAFPVRRGATIIKEGALAAERTAARRQAAQQLEQQRQQQQLDEATENVAAQRRLLGFAAEEREQEEKKEGTRRGDDDDVDAADVIGQISSGGSSGEPPQRRRAVEFLLALKQAQLQQEQIQEQ
jgi:hypothetical protein